ncbi:MAG: hypothetical protein U5K70_01240 [Halodesulfurarchaeum sp.]|nr:hypothetical protein [Halodesulfurarchaeum sp.]
MTESSLVAVRRLLEDSLEACETDECAFNVRTALQLLEAVEEDLSVEHIDIAELEANLEDDDLRARLEAAGIFGPGN